MTHTTQITPEKSIKHLIAIDMVEENLLLFSAVSWKFFTEHGRGYLFFHKSIDVEHVSGNHFKEKETISPLKNALIYIPKDGEVWCETRKSEADAGQTEKWESFYQLVDTYNPRNEFLIVIGMNENERTTEHWFHREPQIPPYKAFLTVKKNPEKFGIEKL